MDLTKSELYLNLHECEGEGADEAFDAMVKANVKDEVMLLVRMHNDPMFKVKRLIELVREVDHHIDLVSLYDALDVMDDDQIREVISEMGIDEISKSIEYKRKVKFGRGSLLNDLKAQYGRHVVVTDKDPTEFQDPHIVKLVKVKKFYVPDCWSHLKRIKGKGCNLHLNRTFDDLSRVRGRSVNTNYVQPAVVHLTTTVADMRFFPNVVVLLVPHVTMTSPMPSVLVSQSWIPDMFPNLRVLMRPDYIINQSQPCTQEGLIIKDSKFAEKREGDIATNYHYVSPTGGKRFFHTKVALKREYTEPLEFYHCTFYDVEYSRVKDVKWIRKMLPNATIL